MIPLLVITGSGIAAVVIRILLARRLRRHCGICGKRMRVRSSGRTLVYKCPDRRHLSVYIETRRRS